MLSINDKRFLDGYYKFHMKWGKNKKRKRPEKREGRREERRGVASDSKQDSVR